MFRLKETPSTAEALCAIGGATVGSVVALKGAAKIWSYVWTLFRFSNSGWRNGKISDYMRRRRTDRTEENNRDGDDERSF